MLGYNCNEQFLPLSTGRRRETNLELQEETELGAQKPPDEKWKFHK